MGSDSSSSDSDSGKDHKKKDKKEKKKDKGDKDKSGDKKDKKDKKDDKDKKDKKDGKDKKDKKDDKDKKDGKSHDGKASSSGHGALPGGIALPTSIAGFATAAISALTAPHSREIPPGGVEAAPGAAPAAPVVAPTATQPATGGTPPQGFRIAIDAGAPFPDPATSTATIGQPPFVGAAGEPIYLGSAVIGEGTEVQPCKIVPSLGRPCRILVAGAEVEHAGKFDLLPLTSDMEWVTITSGPLPVGRRFVDGGFEKDGKRLYHAAATVEGISLPGKTGEHLGAAHIAHGGKEHIVQANYGVLCWRT